MKTYENVFCNILKKQIALRAIEEYLNISQVKVFAKLERPFFLQIRLSD